MRENIGVLVEADPGPGILHQLTGVIAEHSGNITSVDIVEERQTYFEIDVTDGPALLADFGEAPRGSPRSTSQDVPDGLWETHHHHRWRSASWPSRLRCDLGSGLAQHPRGTHLGGHHPFGGRAAPRGRSTGLCAVAPAEGAGSSGFADGRRYRARGPRGPGAGSSGGEFEHGWKCTKSQC